MPDILPKRPIICDGYRYVADVELLAWPDHRLPLCLGAVVAQKGLSLVVRLPRSYYWRLAWEA